MSGGDTPEGGLSGAAQGAGGRRLRRSYDGPPAPPVRMVHLGVGNFFRAHQAWYTQAANEAAPGGDAGESAWGYAAFTGRSPAIAEDLSAQDGLYTLLVKHAEHTEALTVGSLAAVHPGDDVAALRRYAADPALAVVTSTITEAGYRRSAEGDLDLADPQVAADIELLRADPLAAGLDGRPGPLTAPGRLVAALLTRRDALGDGPGAALALCPCDNVPDNGAMLARVVGQMAGRVDPKLPAYVERTCSFVTTMVDRITPRTTDADRAELAARDGVEDPAAVVTAPFTEWVLAGDFPAGRPAWEAGGARFVADVRPYEQRKLWLLNGSHSLMAYAAPLLGHETVAEAIADDRVRAWVEQWWDLACAHLSLPEDELADYRRALLARYANPNIRHLLAQIAADGSQKVPIRHVPALRAQLAAGGPPDAATRAVAAWILHLRGLGAPVADAQAQSVIPLVSGSLSEAVGRVLTYLGLDDAGLAEVVLAQARELEGMAR